MASFIPKGLATNDGIDRLRNGLRGRPSINYYIWFNKVAVVVVVVKIGEHENSIWKQKKIMC